MVKPHGVANRAWARTDRPRSHPGKASWSPAWTPKSCCSVVRNQALCLAQEGLSMAASSVLTARGMSGLQAHGTHCQPRITPFVSTTCPSTRGSLSLSPPPRPHTLIWLPLRCSHRSLTTALPSVYAGSAHTRHVSFPLSLPAWNEDAMVVALAAWLTQVSVLRTNTSS